VTWVRPDGKRFARSPDDIGDYAECREDDVGRWLAAGWTIHRREDEYLVPTVPGAAHPFLLIENADLERLRRLDDELRQDVPGTDGWRWTHEDFVAETHSSPSVYLVTSDYDGICRIWLREPTPRLGFVGVCRSARGRGLGRALVATALGETNERGFADVTTEIDVNNAASQALFRGFDARRIGGYVELTRLNPRP
jgi:ribosomal protein S18 acetylase RimI-like enzyme